ncbi:Fic family protein [Streptomyces sp. bgisy091]|uniref:Fic family protein n=1 Tax=Streptomyces sp. bgisy091 TaxID=3413778 RepID=UPI003D710983
MSGAETPPGTDAEGVHGTCYQALPGTDSLADWCRVRQEVDWAGLDAPAVTGPVTPAADGLVAWCAGPATDRDPVRARRLLAGYAAVRADAERKLPLTFALLSGWQRRVLGTREAPFRTGDAYAKRGRERYALTDRTRADLDACLRESGAPDEPLVARAARTYLDVAFFHPFEDGNGRAALLALTYVLARERVFLSEVGPLQTTRYADDPAGAADLALLVSVLVRRSAAESGPHGRRHPRTPVRTAPSGRP